MARFSDVDVFLAVARARSFRGAAGALGITKSTVSRAIQRLEDHLGAALILRDQRAMRLTAAGAAYHQHATAALTALALGEQAVAAATGSVAGPIRLSAPPALGQILITRACAAFLERFPRASIDLRLTDDLSSLTGDPVDLAVRAGPRLRDSDLRVRRLARAPIIAVASPRVAARLPGALTLPFVEVAYPGRAAPRLPPPPVTLARRLRVNDYLAAREAVIASHGVGLFSRTLVDDALRDGRLVEVLQTWQLPTANYWALMPGNGPLPANLRALLELLVEAFAAQAPAG